MKHGEKLLKTGKSKTPDTFVDFFNPLLSHLRKKTMKLETVPVSIFKSNHEVFEFLVDIKNFEKLMPENIKEFSANNDTFSFSLAGIPEIKLKLKEKVSPIKITLGAVSDKLDFSLTVELKSLSENSTSAQLLFEGEFNPMMAMMLKKPLTNFIETLGKNLQDL